MERVPQVRRQTQDISQNGIHDGQARRPHILRKPVPTRDLEKPHSKEPSLGSFNSSQDASKELTESLDLDHRAPVLPPRPYHPIDTTTPPVDSLLIRNKAYSTTTTTSSLSNGTSPPQTIHSPPSNQPTSPSTAQKAYHQARHFAGSLIQHPSRSTKSHSILRHSHGLVFYHGPNTSLAVSIFATHPLPATRTLWLQRKSWLGSAGMRVHTAAGWNGKWLDVTPATRVEAAELDPHDERAWQRDIAAFVKRSERERGKGREKHVVRETAIVRIPVEAGDGYYRLVLCADTTKKAILCPSPVFRLLSTSSRPSSIRGASLSTLPLEVGARVLSGVAKASAKTTIGNAVQPVVAGVQQQIQPLKPSLGVEVAARAAWKVSGVGRMVDAEVRDAGLVYGGKRDEAFGASGYEDNADYGPEALFPIRIVGSVDYSSRVAEDFDLPISYLTSVPADILRQLNGYYFGWARNFSGGNSEEVTHTAPGSTWHKVVISVIPCDQKTFSTISTAENSKSIGIYLIPEDDKHIALDSQVEVQIMGFIRLPGQPADAQSIEKPDIDAVQAEAALISAINDIEIAQAFLDQPAWAPETSIKERESRNLSPLEKIKSSYADTRMAMQRQVERIPLHKAGIRSRADWFREEAIGRGGVYVRR